VGQPPAPPSTAAAAVFEHAELLELVMSSLDLPALRLLKPTNRCVASVARRVLRSPAWLAAGGAENLHDVRRLFASQQSFKLPMRVVLERFCPRSGAWSRTLATLVHLRAKRCGSQRECRFRPLEVRLIVDGEGLHEGVERLCSHGGSLYTRLQAWDLSENASIVEEGGTGLGLVRPVLSELLPSCDALREPPVVGSTVAELLSVGGIR
jgi:hypothetical protein